MGVCFGRVSAAGAYRDANDQIHQAAGVDWNLKSKEADPAVLTLPFALLEIIAMLGSAFNYVRYSTVALWL